MSYLTATKHFHQAHSPSLADGYKAVRFYSFAQAGPDTRLQAFTRSQPIGFGVAQRHLDFEPYISVVVWSPVTALKAIPGMVCRLGRPRSEVRGDGLSQNHAGSDRHVRMGFVAPSR